MPTTPTQYVRPFQEVAEATAKKLLSAWRNPYKDKVNRYIELLHENLERRRQTERPDTPSTNLWREQEYMVKQFQEWVKNLHSELGTSTPDQVWGLWQETFRTTLETVPETITLEIPPTFWNRDPTDAVPVRLWKTYRAFRYRLRQEHHRILQWIRRHPKKEIPPDTRTFHLHHFLRFTLEYPFAECLYHEWQRLMHLIAQHLYQFHQISEETKTAFLFLSEIETSGLTPSREARDQKWKILEHHLTTIEECIIQLDTFIVDALDQVYTAWEARVTEVKRQWPYAGTFALPEKMFDAKRLQSHWNTLNKQFQQDQTAWQTHWNGEIEEWQKDLELLLLQFRISQLSLKTFETVQSKMETQLIPIFREVKALLAQSLATFTNVDTEDKLALRRHILSENRTLLKTLRDEKLPLMIDSLLQAQVDRFLQEYAYRAKNALEIVSENHTIFKERDLEHIPPRSKVENVALKQLVEDKIFRELAQEHQVFMQTVQTHVEHILRDISETDQIVEFNLEAALTLLRRQRTNIEAFDDAQKIAVEGLERAIKQLDTIIEHCQQIVQQSNHFFCKRSVSFGRQILALADDERILEIQLRIARIQAEEQFHRYYQHVWTTLTQGIPHTINTFIRYSQNALTTLQTRIFHLKKITGLAPTPENVGERIAQFLNETTQRIKHLPYVYQRLFRNEPLRDERFFVGRRAEMVRLQTDFEAWQAGQPKLTAVVGEKGSGKTSLLNFAAKQIFQETTVVKVRLDNTVYTDTKLLEHLKRALKEPDAQNLNELEARILARDESMVCIFENIQNMFLRTIDGFEALESFLLFITKTQSRIHWLLCCTLYSWQYLDKVIHISTYFRRVIHMEIMATAEIKEIILRRNRASGYQLVYEVPPTIANTRKFRRLRSEEEQQHYLEDIFFHQLNDVAASNITVAMLFWQRSIKKNTEDKLVVSPLVDFDHSFLYQLTVDELFILAALLQHENLSIDETARVFRFELQYSALMLNRMEQSGIVIRHKTYYRIHPFLYRPIVRALKIQNILH